MNGFVQGGTFPVKRRGTAPYVKRNNVPVIVLSNYHIENAYSRAGMTAWQTLNARFESITLTTPLFPFFSN
jgi:hypothetical protein